MDDVQYWLKRVARYEALQREGLLFEKGRLRLTRRAWLRMHYYAWTNQNRPAAVEPYR